VSPAAATRSTRQHHGHSPRGLSRVRAMASLPIASSIFFQALTKPQCSPAVCVCVCVWRAGA
jgi:hypothetical protein